MEEKIKRALHSIIEEYGEIISEDAIPLITDYIIESLERD